VSDTFIPIFFLESILADGGILINLSKGVIKQLENILFG